jgi:hypothetical protein
MDWETDETAATKQQGSDRAIIIMRSHVNRNEDRGTWETRPSKLRAVSAFALSKNGATPALEITPDNIVALKNELLSESQNEASGPKIPSRNWEKFRTGTVNTMQSDVKVLKVLVAQPKKRDWIISPNTPQLDAWRIFLGILICHTAVVVPLRVGFNLTPSAEEVAMDLVIDAFFFVDIGINFHTAFEDEEKGKIVRSRRRIARRYTRSWFGLDLLAALPMDLLFQQIILRCALLKRIRKHTRTGCSIH